MNRTANIKHAFINRHGGVSCEPYDSLNLGENVGDDPDKVAENFDIIQQRYKLNKIARAQQVHKTDIIEINHQNYHLEHICDGFITKCSDIALMIRHADCQAALFSDDRAHVIAAIHCGWRGNIGNIYGKTIGIMQKDFDCSIENIKVAISPSLGPDNAEFKTGKALFPLDFQKYQKDNHYNLWEISRQQLLNGGILDKNISIAKICSHKDSSDWFSYRQDGVTGRNGSFIILGENS